MNKLDETSPQKKEFTVDKDINSWTGDDFIAARQKLNECKSYRDKFEYIFSLLGPNLDRLEALIRTNEITINNETFSFGIDISNSQRLIYYSIYNDKMVIVVFDRNFVVDQKKP